MTLKFLLLLPLTACVLFAGVISAQSQSVSPAARAIHDSAMVIDTHADTPLRIWIDNYDLGSIDSRYPEFISLDQAQTGNLGAVFFSIFVIQNRTQTSYSQAAFHIIDLVRSQAEKHSDRMSMAFSAADIERVHSQHKLAALLGLEGGHCIDDSLDLLRDFYRRGVRYMTLTHALSNDWADSSGDVDDAAITHHHGLTPFGKQVVLEMNRLGMVVDISHISDKTFWDVIGISEAPVIASHSSARALTDFPRNMSDDMLRAVGKNGGVVNVNFSGMFIDSAFGTRAVEQHQRMLAAAAAYNQSRSSKGLPVSPDDTQRFDLEWLAANPISRAPLRSLIDHIDHVVRIAGVDHVGLGSDFNGLNSMPEGIDSAADYPKVTQALLDRGYSAVYIKKILGGNMLRVMREVENIPRELRATQHGNS